MLFSNLDYSPFGFLLIISKLNSSKSKYYYICFSPINLLLILTYLLFSLCLTNSSIECITFFRYLGILCLTFLGLGTSLKYAAKLVKSLVSSFVTFTPTLPSPPLLDTTLLLSVLFLNTALLSGIPHLLLFVSL